MKNLTINIDIRALIGFVVALVMGIVLFRSPVLHAQSTSSLSGTFVCLTNKNLAGYTTAAKTWPKADVNQLFTVTFDANNSATISGLIINSVVDYETNNAVTSSVVSSTPMVMTVTANSPSQYMYKFVESGKENKPTYAGLTNNGNTLLILASPQSIDSPNLNGVCQKV